MNKLTIIFMMIIFSCVISTNAVAQDSVGVLSASEFFYGESTVNTAVDALASDIYERMDSQPVSVNLTASDFFYGPIETQPVIIEDHSVPQRTDMADPERNRITPEVFYGYTDRAEGKEAPCSNC